MLNPADGMHPAPGVRSCKFALQKALHVQDATPSISRNASTHDIKSLQLSGRPPLHSKDSRGAQDGIDNV